MPKKKPVIKKVKEAITPTVEKDAWQPTTGKDNYGNETIKVTQE